MRVDKVTFPLVGQQGAWICPRCGVVNAGWVARCICKPEAKP